MRKKLIILTMIAVLSSSAQAKPCNNNGINLLTPISDAGDGLKISRIKNRITNILKVKRGGNLSSEEKIKRLEKEKQIISEMLKASSTNDTNKTALEKLHKKLIDEITNLKRKIAEYSKQKKTTGPRLRNLPGSGLRNRDNKSILVSSAPSLPTAKPTSVSSPFDKHSGTAKGISGVSGMDHSIQDIKAKTCKDPSYQPNMESAYLKHKDKYEKMVKELKSLAYNLRRRRLNQNAHGIKEARKSFFNKDKYPNLAQEDDHAIANMFSAIKKTPKNLYLISRKNSLKSEIETQLQARVDSIETMLSKYDNPNSASRELVRSSLEAVVIEKLLLKGKLKNKKIMSDGSTPSERLISIYNSSPILRRPSERIVGLPSAQLSETIFKKAFNKKSAQEVIAPHYNGNVSGFIQNDLPKAIDKLTDSAMKDTKIQKEISRLLSKTANEWKKELNTVKKKLAGKDRDYLEYMNGTAVNYFQNIGLDKRSKNEDFGNKNWGHLDAFCNAKWGFTKQRIGEAVSSVLVVPSLLLSATPAAPAAAPLAAAFGGAAYTSKVIRSVDTMGVQSAVSNPNLANRLTTHAGNAANVAMGVASVVGGNAAAKSLQAALKGKSFKEILKYFASIYTKLSPEKKRAFFAFNLAGAIIDAKNYMAQGKNPLKEPAYIIARIQGTLGALLLAKGAGTHFNLEFLKKNMELNLMSQGLSITIEQYLQNVNYLISQKEVDPKRAKIRAFWIATASYPRRIILYATNNMTKALFSKATGGALDSNSLAQLAIKLISSLPVGDWSSKVWASYLTGNSDTPLESTRKATKGTLSEIAGALGIKLEADKAEKEMIKELIDLDKKLSKAKG